MEGHACYSHFTCFFFHRGQNEMEKFKGEFWEFLQPTRRSKGLSRKMLNCFAILIMEDQTEQICELLSDATLF